MKGWNNSAESDAYDELRDKKLQVYIEIQLVDRLWQVVVERYMIHASQG